MRANTARSESKAIRIVATGTVCSAALTCAVAYAIFASTESPRVEVDTSVADHHRARADCLWRSARDHGFYGVQSRAIGAAGDAAARELWVGFATTTGARECGHPGDDLEPLVRALADTRDDADRHFLAGS